MNYTVEQIAGMIDHSLLQPQLTDDDMENGCKVAIKYGVASVCIKPYYLRRCAEILAGSRVAPSTVIGFPHGGHTTTIKVKESEQALADGGRELDYVVNIGKVLTGDWDYVAADIKAVLDVVRKGNALLKVIFENCHLTDRQKIKLCEICGELGVDFAKTSTGYGSSGATLEDVRLMRKHLPAKVQVKAAGGVRDLDAVLAMRAAGVTRVGATRTVEIVDECRRRLGSQSGTLL